MITSPTYIHLRTQWHLLGPESPGQQFEKQRFQEFFAALNTDTTIGDYDDFSYRPERFECAKQRVGHPKGAQGFSKVVYANDQLTVVEEWAEISAGEFERYFTGILRAWFKHFPETLAVAQKCCVRALQQAQNYDNSPEFLGNKVLRLGDHLADSFIDMPHQVGFTAGCVRPLGDQRLVIDTKVNSWRDNRSIWIEVAGSIALQPPINATNPESAQRPFTECREFLEREVIGLLKRFDQPPEAE